VADDGIKKITVPYEDFPLIQFTTTYNPATERQEVDTLYYDLRYRIASEDRNRYSHWSPIQRLFVQDIAGVFPYTESSRISIRFSGSPTFINVAWTNPPESSSPSNFEKIINDTDRYDVWIRWNENDTTNLQDPGWTDWSLVATVASNNFSTLKEDPAYKRVEVAIQTPTVIKIRDYNNNKLTLFRGLSGTI
jgi:hypothetical protein